MAFSLKNLSVLAYANGFTLWHYKTTDPDTEVDDTDYFLEAIDMLRPGDMILANTGDGGTVAGGIFRIVGNDGATIDAANMTAVGATNT